MSSLIKLLQPPEYVSKIKLYCNYSKFNIEKVAQKENQPYICNRETSPKRILITEIN